MSEIDLWSSCLSCQSCLGNTILCFELLASATGIGFDSSFALKNSMVNGSSRDIGLMRLLADYQSFVSKVGGHHA